MSVTAKEFLQHVWPETGIYVIATPFMIPGTDRQTYAHKTFTSIAEAARFAESRKASTDVYFGVHTLKAPQVWHPTKHNHKTGETGAYAVRTHANMKAARALFLDLDVGSGAAKFASQREALADLRQFCQLISLPKPTIVSSGGGIHVYWTFDDEIASPEWKVVAERLRQLVRHHHLKADPARITDTASLLRVAGTFNRKRPVARAVEVWMLGACTPWASLNELIDVAITRAGVTALPLAPARRRAAPHILGAQGDVGTPSNLTPPKGEAERRLAAYIRAIPPKGDGDRNITAFRIAAVAINECHVSVNDTVEVLRLWNRRNLEPMPEEKLPIIAANAMQHGRGGTL